jgi:hypothetical protein
MTEDLTWTPEYKAKIRTARKIAIATSVVVGVIFAVAGVLGYYSIKYDRPVKMLFDPSLDPANAPNTERNAPPKNEAVP